MDDIFSKLKAQLQTSQPQADLPIKPPDPTWLNGIPPLSMITVMTLNFFDNGSDRKVKWSSARYAMNIQMFTQTQPFTPSVSLAAWKGTIQLHDPDFWMRYVEHKKDKMDETTFEHLKAIYVETFKTFPDGTLLGTFTDKNSGTNYSWLYVMRFWFDEFDEPNLQICLDEAMPTIDVWETVVPVPGQNLPVLRARHDPHKLWRRGRSPGKGRKHQ
jgi:hypothetical protein